MSDIAQGDPLNPNPLSVHGPLWFDVRNYGASPAKADNAPAIQAAHDAAVAAIADWTGHDSSRAPQATVFIPAGRDPYHVKGSVEVDGSYVRFLGEGHYGTHGTKVAASGFSGAVFRLGFPRKAGGVTAAHRPDLYGILDSSVASAAGQRWGFRSRGDAHVRSMMSAFSHGGSRAAGSLPDFWRETDFLTLELSMEGFASGKIPAGTTLVACTVDSFPMPYVLGMTATDVVTLSLGYQAVQFGPMTISTYTISTAGLTGMIRLAVQVDLLGATVAAWLNGTQVAVTGTVPPGVRLAEPGAVPGRPIDAWYLNGQNFSGNPTDWACYGFSQSRTPKYASRGVGAAQTPNPQTLGNSIQMPGTPTGGTWTITYPRGGTTTGPLAWNISTTDLAAALNALPAISGAGGVTVSGAPGVNYSVNGAFYGLPGMCDGSNLTGFTLFDKLRYQPVGNDSRYYDPHDIGHLLFTEDPATGGRDLAINGSALAGGGNCQAVIFNASTWTTDPIAAYDSFEDIEIDGGAGYGVGIMFGHVLEIAVLGCHVSGGMCGLADFPFGANYVITVKDSLITGYFAGIYAYDKILHVDSVTFGTNGCWCAYLVGCQTTWNHIQVATTAAPQYGQFRFGSETYGGFHTINDFTIDSEGASNQVAAFYIEASGYIYVTVKVDTAFLGTQGYSPTFMLRGIGGASDHPGISVTANTIFGDTTDCVVDCDSPTCNFTINGAGSDYGSDVHYTPNFPGQPFGVVNSGGLIPPRWGRYYRRASNITNSNPNDGQFLAITPGSAGVWGSATPATWVATAIATPADPTSTLASYIVDHTAFGLTPQGQSPALQGYVGTRAAALMAATLFGGPIAGLSAVLALGGAGLGGTFAMSFGGQTASAIPYNVSAATLQSTLQGLSSIGAGNVTVSGSGPWTITLAGTLARTAGSILGLTVDPTNLTATGGTATLTNPGPNGVIALGGRGLGGTFTIHDNQSGGVDTTPLAWNATALQIRNALVATGATFTQYALIHGRPGGPYETNIGDSVNGSGLTATGGSATLTPTDLPGSHWIAAMETDSRKPGDHYAAADTSLTGLARTLVPSVIGGSGFTAASGAAKSNAAAINLGTTTAAVTIHSFADFDAGAGGNMHAMWQLAAPITFAAGQQVIIPAGALTFANVPVKGIHGTMADYGWSRLYDLWYGGVSFAVPTSWSVALSTAPLTHSAATPTEPSGGYARASAANDTAHWGQIAGGQVGDYVNVLPIAFPVATGSQAPSVAVAILDPGGNPWFAGPLTAAATPAVGGAAPAFAANCLMIGLG